MKQISGRAAYLLKAVSNHFLLQKFCSATYVTCYKILAEVSACYLTKYLQEEVNSEQKLLLSITDLNPKTTGVIRGETRVSVTHQLQTKAGWERQIFVYGKESRANQ